MDLVSAIKAIELINKKKYHRVSSRNRSIWHKIARRGMTSVEAGEITRHVVNRFHMQCSESWL